MNPCNPLQVGSGSGIIITALKQVLKSTAFCLGVDINEHACKMTKSTSWNNNCPVDVIQGDLISCFKSNSIDLIVFNPPYVVTSNDEVQAVLLL